MEERGRNAVVQWFARRSSDPKVVVRACSLPSPTGDKWEPATIREQNDGNVFISLKKYHFGMTSGREIGSQIKYDIKNQGLKTDIWKSEYSRDYFRIQVFKWAWILE